MNDSLVQKVVHDMRSPLMGIHGNLELVKHVDGKKLSAKGFDYLNNAMSAAVELMEMVACINDIRQLGAGERKVSLSKLDLADVCRSAAAKLSGLANDKQVELKPPEGPMTVNADRELVQRVFYILIGNALRYSPQKERVVVTFRGDDKCVCARVSDRGPAIPEKARETLFELPVKSGGGERLGPGLGLAFCKIAVDAHNGRIGVECPDGKETVFWFELPRV
jgi:K+-sensing histidine kinase KdpD